MAPQRIGRYERRTFTISFIGLKGQAVLSTKLKKAFDQLELIQRRRDLLGAKCDIANIDAPFKLDKTVGGNGMGPDMR